MPRRNVEKIWTEYISTRQFLSYKPNPRQRNTILRADFAKNKHLKKFLPHHAVVHVSQLSNGIRFLADGHTRQLLMRSGHFRPIDMPQKFIAIVQIAKDMDEVAEHYRYYDSSNSVERPTDKNYSAMKSQGYEFKSKRFQKPTDLGAVSQICCEGVHRGDTDTWMQLWRDEIIELDNYNIPVGSKSGVGKTLRAPVIAASLMLINRGYDVKEFLMDIRNDGGTKSGSKKCGVKHFVDWILKTDEKTSGGGGYPNVAEKTIACFDLYNSGRMRTQCPKLTKNMIAKYVKIKKAPVSS